ncbi:phage holin family protein [Vagococcus coleopterorum]|uniref:Phage holin family protein n=1 Tax=Vagococcus coleopterorum TaxID=2714946 RepID=A0A6G8APW3_9ENTE|nr:phage holin family protein [Vagococcus coleopterorum]QIL47009.1 phage holin family protein [Vagococcus coleopterorum]
MGYFQSLIVSTLTFISLSVILPDNMLYVSSILVALIASFVLSLLNVLVKPILHLLSLPITFLTLGLFSFVINAVILQLTSAVLGEQNFMFSSFGASILVAVIMTLVNSVVVNHNLTK